MKRWFSCLLLLILTLTGCAVNQNPEFECLSDTLEHSPAPSYYLAFDLPAEAVLTSVCDDGCCALFTCGECEIYQEIFLADSVDAALLSLTGQTARQLGAICVGRAPCEEYRFAWTAAGENGLYACSGAVFFDGEYAYGLTVRCPEGAQKAYEAAIFDIPRTVSCKAV